jgi:hypothetical protein
MFGINVLFIQGSVETVRCECPEAARISAERVRNPGPRRPRTGQRAFHRFAEPRVLLERLVCSAEYVGRVSATYTPPGAGGVSLMLTHDSPQGLSRAAAQSAVQTAGTL